MIETRDAKFGKSAILSGDTVLVPWGLDEPLNEFA